MHKLDISIQVVRVAGVNTRPSFVDQVRILVDQVVPSGAIITCTTIRTLYQSVIAISDKTLEFFPLFGGFSFVPVVVFPLGPHFEISVLVKYGAGFPAPVSGYDPNRCGCPNPPPATGRAILARELSLYPSAKEEDLR